MVQDIVGQLAVLASTKARKEQREEEGHGENVEAHPDDDQEGKEKQ